MPVIVVGGGSILVSRPVAGASEMVKPPHFEAANAVGAAIAPDFRAKSTASIPWRD